MARVMPGRTSGAKQKMHHMHIEPADGGGHVIEHHAEHGPMQMGEEHILKRHVFGAHEGHEAIAHIAKHAKIDVAEGENQEGADGEDQVANPA